MKPRAARCSSSTRSRLVNAGAAAMPRACSSLAATIGAARRRPAAERLVDAVVGGGPRREVGAGEVGERRVVQQLQQRRPRVVVGHRDGDPRVGAVAAVHPLRRVVLASGCRGGPGPRRWRWRRGTPRRRTTSASPAVTCRRARRRRAPPAPTASPAARTRRARRRPHRGRRCRRAAAPRRCSRWRWRTRRRPRASGPTTSASTSVRSRRSRSSPPRRCAG